MENKIKLISEQIKAIMATEKKFARELRKLLDSKDRSLGKKINKSLKKMEFYIEGGEEIYKDAVRTLDRYIEKNCPAADNPEEVKEVKTDNK
ncbi:MAG TPA: hypothetical protein PLG34_06285 [Spirochaetota bacterium]|jgi:hypothetical protein|nr:MAG: hypothetical protein BWX91_00558 [Spirochaetes bacterium ADurb.Bin133]HPY87571.1 hypothetical protein [Spirochaetota bacterium]HQB61074.1 hypothetical protein [Spirochaetota bacterium]